MPLKMMNNFALLVFVAAIMLIGIISFAVVLDHPNAPCVTVGTETYRTLTYIYYRVCFLESSCNRFPNFKG